MAFPEKLRLKLDKEVKGSVLISALEKAAEDMNLELRVHTNVASVKLDSSELEYRGNLIIVRPHLWGHLFTPLAQTRYISPNEMYKDFELHRMWAEFKGWKEYLDLVSRYLSGKVAS